MRLWGALDDGIEVARSSLVIDDLREVMPREVNHVVEEREAEDDKI